jgi:tetratricopeptide (TPR) repeat protein
VKSVVLWLASMSWGPSVVVAGPQDVLPGPGARELELGEDHCDADGVYRRSFLLAIAGPCTLYARAEAETLDPTLVGGLLGQPPKDRDQGRAGASAAFLNMGLETEADHEVELVLESSRPGRVQLAVTVAPASLRCAAAASVAEAALAQHAERLRSGNRAGAEASLAAGVEQLFALATEDLSWPATGLLDRVGRAAYDARLPAISYEARVRVLAFFEHHYPERHPDLQLRRFFFAESCDLVGERGLEIAALERAMAAVEIVRPSSADLPIMIMDHLGIALSRVGRVLEARACIETLVQELERSSFADKHVRIANQRNHLAVTLYQMGDLAGARAQCEELLTRGSNVLSADARLKVQGNLAMVLSGMGLTEEAAELQEEVLAGFEAFRPDEHPDVDRARVNLAMTLGSLGRSEASDKLLEPVLAREELGPDDPVRLLAQFQRGMRRAGEGDLTGARLLLDDVLARRERALDPDHPHLHETRLTLARVLFQLGDHEALTHELQQMLAALRLRISGAAGLGWRERGELASQVAGTLRDLHVLACAARDPRALEAELFGVTESLRALSALSARVPHATHLSADLHALRKAWREASVRLAELPTRDPSTGLSGLVQDMVQAERAFRQALARRGWIPSPDVNVESVARMLAPGCAAVAYRRLARSGEPLRRAGVDHASDELVANVVLQDGSHRFLVLAESAEVDELVSAWRAAVGRPLGGTSAASDAKAEVAAGRKLRALALDPVLAVAEGAHELRVCLDDALHLLPLDALPWDDGPSVVADRLQLVVVPSLAGGTSSARSGATPCFVGVGAVDYGETTDGRTALFEPLPGTEREVRSVAALFGRVPGCETRLLLGGAATAERIRLATENASHLLVATHGFCDERVRTWNDPPPPGAVRRDRDTLIGLAPLAACGLVLSGANRSLQGVLLAEELATWDLSRLELAVLSACETGVGLRRSGQGVASLQAALHAAGAHTVIASLWRVDDESTQRLFQRFFAHLLDEPGLAPAEALARAKRELRTQRRPTRDWAPWLLTRASGG